MSEKTSPMLSEVVEISRHYQRSIRIDIDLGRSDALDGYICHGTAVGVLESMCKQLVETSQRAFTWTGPFGGGKSSLAVAMASALAPSKSLRTKAREVLRLDAIPSFDKAFPYRRGWLPIPIVGRRGSVVMELAKGLRKAQGRSQEVRKASAGTLIEDLCAAAEAKDCDGVLILIDEMGKFLEASALGMGDDVNFFQDLAEIASRSAGRIVIVGILHQSFSQYAGRLGIDSRGDWAKVQGRYADIPLVAASDEVVELIGRAIVVQKRFPWMQKASDAIASSIKTRRPAVGPGFARSLNACWPLHPAMAALLGPISKRQFGQNERSTFGFLASVEPYGFRSFLQTTKLAEMAWYRPDHYWEYLRANLEPAILASSDGHRWAQAVEAVERTEAKTSDAMELALVKNIAVIDLFRNGSGLAAETEVLAELLFESKAKVEAALARLASMHVILFKKHIGAWSVFEGSDFDIEAAISQARGALPSVDFALLASLTNLYPVIAKRHYHLSGTMRWMNVALCRLEEAPKLAAEFAPKNGEFGLFLLALPGRGVSEKQAVSQCQEHSRPRPWPVAIGVPKNHTKIEDLGAELIALRHVQSRHELAGDAVARREVQARISDVRANLEEQLRAAVSNAQWFAGETPINGAKLSPIASDLADDLYKRGPELWSELVNRDSPSSNSVKARRDLMHLMLTHEQEPLLGIKGYPAERGLYETLLATTGLHCKDADGHWRFMPPAPGNLLSESFLLLWEETRAMFSDVSARVKVPDILRKWSMPPFGLRAGATPVIFTAFVLSHKSNIAVYKDGVFIPHLTDADLDEFLQDGARFSLRWVVIDEEKTSILAGISKILAEVGATAGARDPLEAARGLVALVFGLPAWSQRTHRISPEARTVRDILLKAHDPHKVLFVDLAAALESSGAKTYVNALRAPVGEIAGAYDKMLKGIEVAMMQALDAPTDRYDRLQTRATALESVTGDLRQDAFATRLAKHDGSRESIEGILSLAANKPPRDWSDRDIDVAQLELAQAALRFRQAEAFVSVKGRKPTSEAFAVVMGAGAQTLTISRAFSLSDRHRAAVEAMADKLATELKSGGMDTDVLLAVLVRAGMRLAVDEDSKKENAHG